MTKSFGTPLRRFPDSELIADAAIEIPGLGWEIDPETVRKIEAIEANARLAHHRARLLPLD